MGTLGVVLLVVAGILLIACLGSVYSTTMTVRRSRLSPWALPLAASAVILGVLGGILVL